MKNKKALGYSPMAKHTITAILGVIMILFVIATGFKEASNELYGSNLTYVDGSNVSHTKAGAGIIFMLGLIFAIGSVYVVYRTFLKPG